MPRAKKYLFSAGQLTAFGSRTCSTDGFGRAAESWAQWITKLRIKTRIRPSTDRIVSITVHDLNVPTTDDSDRTHHITKSLAKILNDVRGHQAGEEAQHQRGDQQTKKRVNPEAGDEEDKRDDG